MVKILGWIISILILFFSIKMIIKTYKSLETLVEKVLYILSLMIFFIIITIYYLDRYDMPTRLGMANNINTERWFNFTSNYIIGLVGQIISGAILVLITLKQISVQIENNTDDKRIQNAPIFKYNISNNSMVTTNKFYFFNGDNHSNIYSLLFQIENIGLNHARHISIFVSGDNIKKEQVFKFDDSQGILKKDDTIIFELILNYDGKKKQNMKNINISITYEDMLNNKYSQNININGEATNVYGSQYGGYKFNILECEINNEIYIKEK